MIVIKNVSSQPTLEKRRTPLSTTDANIARQYEAKLHVLHVTQTS